MLLVRTVSVSCAAQSPEWHLPPRQGQILPGSLDGWEPALAVGSRGVHVDEGLGILSCTPRIVAHGPSPVNVKAVRPIRRARGPKAK